MKILKARIFWLFFLFLYFVVGYLAINSFSENRQIYAILAVSLDHSIPFLPIFIYGYASVYVAIFTLYYILKDNSEFYRAVAVFFTVTTLSFLIFLIYPVKMVLRPDLSAMSGFSVDVTRLFYSIDKPFNNFPSLHVAYPLTAMLVTWVHHKTARYMYLGLFLLISVSVVFVKQHYIADVVSAVMISTISYFTVEMLRPKFITIFNRTLTN